MTKISNLNKRRKDFICEVLILFLCIKGRINFLQLGRYGLSGEQRYRQQFEKPFNFLAFNKELVLSNGSGRYVTAFDPSYIDKSGKKTSGLGWYWSGCAGKAKWGLEIGGIAAIDIDNHTAFHLEAVQTLHTEDQTLTQWYIDLLEKRKKTLAVISAYFVADAWFSKKPFVDQIIAMGMHFVCRLRDDADLMYLYSGAPTGKKGRRGFNFWLLLTVADKFGSPFFLTFNQVKELGGHVLKGEKGFPVVFWKLLDIEEKDGSIDQVPFLRYYTVFNLKQTEGIDKSKIPSTEAHDHDFDPIGQAEQLIEFWSDSPEIRLNQSHAFYSPSGDYIGMPNPRTFFQDEQYYSTIFHEAIHSTGHIHRTGRHEKQTDHKFGSHDYSYSQEELVAEMGAAYLCYITGIQNATIDNSAAYIKSWIGKFKEDKKMLLVASSQAQKAVDYILEHQSYPNQPEEAMQVEQLAEAV